MEDRKHQPGQCTIPEFVALAKKLGINSKIHMSQQIFQPCYWETPEDTGPIGMIGCRGIDVAEQGSQGSQGCVPVQGIQDDGLSANMFRFVLNLYLSKNIDISKFNQQLSVSAPGGRICKSKYIPVEFNKIVKCKRVTVTMGVYKKDGFDEYAKLLRKEHPELSDLAVATRGCQDNSDYDDYVQYNPDFTFVKVKDTDQNCITTFQIDKCESIETNVYECQISLCYVDVQNATNTQILESFVNEIKDCITAYD